MELRHPQGNSRVWSRAEAAYTLAEIVVSVLLLSSITVALFAAFAAGSQIVETTRENLRATQLLTQKMETIRLLTWEEGANRGFAPTNFYEAYDPNAPSNSHGVIFQGFVSPAAPAPSSIPSDYRNNMRLMTVTVYWTNAVRGSTNAPIVHSRQMQTLVSRYGLQNYVYQ